MAKFYVGKGIDEYLGKLQFLDAQTKDVLGGTIHDGAKIVADEIRAAIDSIPAKTKGSNRGVTDIQRRGLKESMGIAPMREDEGQYLNVKVGFDGYNAERTKQYPNGKPNAMIARSIESGTSFSPKTPFIAPAVRRTQKAAENVMRIKLDSEIKAIMDSEIEAIM